MEFKRKVIFCLLHRYEEYVWYLSCKLLYAIKIMLMFVKKQSTVVRSHEITLTLFKLQTVTT